MSIAVFPKWTYHPSPSLYSKDTCCILYINCMLLHYYKSLDVCMLPIINTIYTTQTRPTVDNIATFNMIIEYAYSDAIFHYFSSGIRIYVESNATYLVLPQVKSWQVGVFYLSKNLYSAYTISSLKINGTILTKYFTIIGNPSPAVKAEACALHYNSKYTMPIRTTFLVKKWSQANPVSLKTNDITASDVTTKIVG